MSKRLIQINFNYSTSQEQLAEGALQALEAIAQTPGLLWKIWLYNDQQKIAGGIYLFADDSSAQAYLDGAVVKGLRENPVFKNFSAHRFEIMADASRATHAEFAL